MLPLSTDLNQEARNCTLGYPKTEQGPVAPARTLGSDLAPGWYSPSNRDSTRETNHQSDVDRGEHQPASPPERRGRKGDEPQFSWFSRDQEMMSTRQTDPQAGVPPTSTAESAICVRHISVSGALQFAVFHAVCCVLHRPASQVIHCSELYVSFLSFQPTGFSEASFSPWLFDHRPPHVEARTFPQPPTPLGG